MWPTKTKKDSLESDRAVAAQDEMLLNELGYKQELTRSMTSFDNFCTSMGALYCIGGVQVLFSTALQQGGPLAIWTNWIIASVFTYCIATSLAEICSTFPTAGSMYYWAFETAGQKFGPLASWVVAWLTILSWITNVASDVTAGAQFITNEPLAFNITSFDINLDDFGARAIQFGLATLLLVISTLVNLVPQRYFRWSYIAFALLMVVSFVMNVVWLPIAVSKTYGFQNSTTVWTGVINNVDGATTGYAWILSFLFPMYTLAGFDASGHVAEETKQASKEAPRGIVRSMVASSAISFPIIIMFLYCVPNIDDYLNSDYEVQVIYMYQAAFGSNGQAAVVAVSIALWLLNSIITLQAASRIVFAIARDHVLPFSTYLRARNRYNQPYSAVLFCSAWAFVFLLTILPSQYAFGSITSASVVAITAAYGIIIGGRVTVTRDTFKQRSYSNGKFSIALGYIATIFSAFIFVCLCLPTSFPVSATEFNFAPVILGIWLIICLSNWFLSARHWFKGPVREVTGVCGGSSEVLAMDATAEFMLSKAPGNQ